MHRILIVTVIAALLMSVGTADAQSALTNPAALTNSGRSGDYWLTYTQRLPIGSTIRVRTVDGKRVTAVLAIVDDTGITVEPKTRVPEEPRHIPFAALQQVELAQSGASTGKAVAIGVGVGVASFFGMMLVMLAAWGD